MKNFDIRSIYVCIRGVILPSEKFPSLLLSELPGWTALPQGPSFPDLTSSVFIPVPWILLQKSFFTSESASGRVQAVSKSSSLLPEAADPPPPWPVR